MTPSEPWIRPKALIGMVHAGAMPGTPYHRKPPAALAREAAREAALLADAGFDAIIIENMHDRPYVHGRQSPEVVSVMTRVAVEVASTVDLPLGIQILSGGEREAIAVAAAAGAQFIRCENFVYAHIADEGVLDRAAAGPLLRYRRAVGATDVRIMCDIKKKHASHALTADLTIGDMAHGAEFFGADGVIVTGGFTGRPTEPGDVREVAEVVSIPVWVGSGVAPEHLEGLYAHADALIVGSWIKNDGAWTNPVDPARCRELVARANAVRG